MRVNKLHLLFFIFTFCLGYALNSLGLYFAQRLGGPVSIISPIPTGPSVLDYRNETEIYRAIILDEHSQEKLIVIRAESGWYYSVETSSGGLSQQFFEPSDGVQEETLEDYNLKNHNESQLMPGDLGVNYILVSEAEMRGLFENNPDRGWVKFRERYPNANGLLTFSRVGFNRSHTQALVYVGWGCDLTCGSGGYLLLQKRGNNWSLKGVGSAWIS